MVLRYVRRTLTVDKVLNVAIATTAATESLANLASFPPASVAAAILLKIFQTIQAVQTNRSECYRLASRCLSLLVDMRDQMQDQWATAPSSLLKAIRKFGQTLESIHAYLKGEAEHKWTTRLLRKGTIEGALAQYHVALDDAARSFQIATLINIHYAVGDRKQEFSSAKCGAIVLASTTDNSPSVTSAGIQLTDSSESIPSPIAENQPDIPVRKTSSTVDSQDYVLVSDSTSSLVDTDEPDDPDYIFSKEDTEILNSGGFRRYHRSDLTLRGRSRVKEGWWAGATEGRADGRDVLVMTFEGLPRAAMKRWMRDVRLLQNVFHPNLPQMVGYSGEGCPTPFILLANVQTRLPQALVLEMINKSSLAGCVGLILRFYRDVLEAALYMQRQLKLSESKLQDYVENASYRVDGEATLVMGLPPPEVDNVTSWRNFGLAHSIREQFFKLLPNHGYATEPYNSDDTSTSVERQLMVNHLSVILKAVLPSSEDPDAASTRLQCFLKDEDEDEIAEYGVQPLNLRDIRLAAIQSNTLQHTWRQKLAPPYKYFVGDIGHVPAGEDPSSLTVLGNILRGGDEPSKIDVSQSTHGDQFSFEDAFVPRHPLQSFPYFDNRHGWSIMLPLGSRQNVQIVHESYFVSPSQAWHFLLERGKDLASSYGVKPQDLILVTRAGVDLRFVVQSTEHNYGFSHSRLSTFMQPPAVHQPFMHPQAMHPHSMGFPGSPAVPTLLYLFTSADKDQSPIWSDSPSCHPPTKNSPALQARCLISTERAYGFYNYVQLHAEDFVN